MKNLASGQLKTRTFLVIGLALMFGMSSTAHSQIIYSLVPIITTNFTVTGTITTDGTLGAVTQTNFIDASITIQGPSRTALLDPLPIFVEGPINATATQLSGVDDNSLLQWREGGSFATLIQILTNWRTVKLDGGQETLSSQPAVFASGGAAVVPEPTTLALFGLGLAGAGVARWRKRKA